MPSIGAGSIVENGVGSREPVQTWDSHVKVNAPEAESSARLFFYSGFGAPLLWGISAIFYWPQIHVGAEEHCFNETVRKYACASMVLFVFATIGWVSWVIVYWVHGEDALGVEKFESWRVSEDSVNFYLSL